jgi:hypothetical protein
VFRELQLCVMSRSAFLLFRRHFRHAATNCPRQPHFDGVENLIRETHFRPMMNSRALAFVFERKIVAKASW